MSVIETPKAPEYRDSDTGDILVDGNIYNELHSLPNDDYVYESDDSISDDADTNKPITYVRKYLVLNEWLNEKYLLVMIASMILSIDQLQYDILILF